jgi:hypothetical protein
LEDPAGHAYPAAQSPLHEDEFIPRTSPNFPPGQLEQSAALAKLYRPTAQINAVALVELTGHAYPALQGPLQRGDVAPGDRPNLPAEQLLHDAAPARLY